MTEPEIYDPPDKQSYYNLAAMIDAGLFDNYLIGLRRHLDERIPEKQTQPTIPVTKEIEA